MLVLWYSGFCCLNTDVVFVTKATAEDLFSPHMFCVVLRIAYVLTVLTVHGPLSRASISTCLKGIETSVISFS